MTQKEALEVLKRGHNVYLTGAAGSGKTYLLNKYIQFLKAQRIGVGITASTGIAATHMEGITIHSWAGIGIRGTASDDELRAIAANKRIAKRFQRTQTLIIDEVSMFDANRLDLVERLARLARGSWEPFGGMQVVLCGDFFQLPPVAKENEPPPRFVCHSAAWKSMALKICYLQDQYRQEDKELVRILNAIRDASVDETVVNRLRERRIVTLAADPLGRIVKLYTHNINVDLENERELAKLPEKETTYYMQVSGVPAIAELLKKGCLAPEKLALKKGAAVMFVKNNFERGYVNGTLGTVSGFSKSGSPIITVLNGGDIIAELATWSIEENGKILAEIRQLPLRLAWAITVHKSQGMTLDAAQVDLSKCFEKGMGYVALSRVRSLAGIRVIGFNDLALEVNTEMLTFDQELKKRSEETVRELGKFEYVKKAKEGQKTYSVAKIRETHPAAYQKWTSEEEDRLIVYFRAGKTTTVIAAILGRKFGGIRSRLRKLGLVK